LSLVAIANSNFNVIATTTDISYPFSFFNISK